MTSIALAERGHKVTILDRYEDLSGWGSVLNLGPQVAKVLDRYGILKQVEGASGGFNEGLCFRRWQNGDVLLHIPAEMDDKTYGLKMASGKRSDFQQILYDKAKSHGITRTLPKSGMQR